MNKKYDAIIIGAGVIGCPIAYEKNPFRISALIDSMFKCLIR